MNLPEHTKQICIWLIRGNANNKDKSTAFEKKVASAVNFARKNIGADLQPNQQKQLEEEMMKNIMSGRKYPYERLNLDCISRTDYYRRKDKFLKEIANRLKII